MWITLDYQVVAESQNYVNTAFSNLDFPFFSQDIVTYTSSQKMEHLSLPRPSSSTLASQNLHEDMHSEDTRPGMLEGAMLSVVASS